jgi:hypothetical protein
MNSISLDQLRSQMPQAFVEAPHSRVSSKYSFIPTHQILGDLDKLGWKIREVQNPRYKSQGNQLHGKHLIRLFNPNLHISKGADKNYVEIALYNSSNGQSKFRMEIGIFRMVCSNGMVIKTEDFGSINMRHSGYSFESLKESIDEMIEKLPQVVTKINTFTERILTPAEMKSLAQEAYNLRNGGRQATENELQAILNPRRTEDEGDNLWVTFNRIQEAVITGGQMFVDKRGRMRTAKPIRNLDKGLKLNQQLWQLAEQYA